jgi:hypothetical protein
VRAYEEFYSLECDAVLKINDVSEEHVASIFRVLKAIEARKQNANSGKLD